MEALEKKKWKATDVIKKMVIGKDKNVNVDKVWNPVVNSQMVWCNTFSPKLYNVSIAPLYLDDRGSEKFTIEVSIDVRYSKLINIVFV